MTALKLTLCAALMSIAMLSASEAGQRRCCATAPYQMLLLGVGY